MRVYEQAVEKPVKHNGIKCRTCKKMLGSKREMRSHIGHEVVYLKNDGTEDS